MADGVTGGRTGALGGEKSAWGGEETVDVKLSPSTFMVEDVASIEVNDAGTSDGLLGANFPKSNLRGSNGKIPHF